MIVALPMALRSELAELEQTISAWPIQVAMDRVVRWVLQFDVGDYVIATRILKHLQVLGSSDIRSALEIGHVKLQRQMALKGAAMKGNNTLFAAVGNAAKSGAMIAYQYRMAAELPESDFVSGDEEDQLDLSKIENIVFVDDVIGTGKTVADELKSILEEVYSLEKSRNTFVLSVAAYSDGARHVLNETGATVVSALEYDEKDTISSLDAGFFRGLPVGERTIIQDAIKKYCRTVSKSDLGFGNLGGLLVLDHNTPNTTLPIIWSRGKNWIPLFPRSTRIPGAAKVLRSVKQERVQEVSTTTTPPPSQVEPSAMDVTLFVEGKLDELFVDYLRQNRDLAAKIGVREVNAVALGGLYQSERLFELLRTAKKHAIFVLDEEENEKRAIRIAEGMANVHVVVLKPSFTALLDVVRIAENEDLARWLPDRESARSDISWYHDVERSLLKRGPISSNSERIFQIIGEFLDPEKYEVFVQDLRAAIEALSRA